MSKTSLYFILIILLSIIWFKNQDVQSQDEINNIKPKIISPKQIIEKPKLETNLVYDDLNKAIALGRVHNRNIVIVFGAEWCPYCVVLKKDASKITQFDNYIVAFLDTDNKEANQQAVNLYRPRGLPTSVIIDVNKKELSRKIGYRNKDYTKWLDTLRR